MEAHGSGSMERAVRRSHSPDHQEYAGGKKFKSDEASFFDKYTYEGETQPFSIQWLDLKKVKKHIQENLEKSEITESGIFSLSEAIDSIVTIYNKKLMKSAKKKKKEKAPQYKYDSSGTADGYYLIHYSMTSEFTRGAEKQTQDRPVLSHKNVSLFFFYQNEPPRLMALTNGDAWRVVSLLCEYSVPFRIAEKVANPKSIIEVERRCLFGRNAKEKLLHIGEKTSFQISNLYHLVESFKCDLKVESRLYDLIDRIIKEHKAKEKNLRSSKDFDEDREQRREYYDENIEDDDIEDDDIEDDDIDDDIEDDDGEDDEKNKDEKINRKKSRCWIKVTRKGLRIGKKLHYKFYPAILDLLTKYREGTTTWNTKGIEEKADSLFKFLHFFESQQVYKLSLDEKLIDHIFFQYEKREKPQVDVRHPRLEDYLLSNLYELKIGDHTNFREIGSKPPELDELVEMILKKKIENIDSKDKDAFSKGLKESKLRFTVNENSQDKPTESLIDCLEGQIFVEQQSYFKVHKVWYAPTSDYFSLLNVDFKEMVEDRIIEEKTEWWLDVEWQELSSKSNVTEEAQTSKGKRKSKGKGKGTRNDEEAVEEAGISKKRNEEEGLYNRQYLNRKGYIVFDKITPDGIEYCDILRYNESAVYLYQVKKDLGQHTREACSQILNAATLIRSAHRSPSSLERLYERAINPSPEGKEIKWRKIVAEQLMELGKESFVNIFKTRKITFVYAYVPKDPEKSFVHYLKEIKKPLERSVINCLVTLKYLDEYEQLTDEFFSSKKEDFIEEMFKKLARTKGDCGKLYDQLNARELGTKSNIAKMELLRLAQNLQALGFDLKICEINKKKSVNQLS